MICNDENQVHNIIVNVITYDDQINAKFKRLFQSEVDRPCL